MEIVGRGLHGEGAGVVGQFRARPSSNRQAEAPEQSEAASGLCHISM